MSPLDADLALRLMLADPAAVLAELGALDGARWRELVRVLRANVVLVRVADRCVGISEAVAPLIEAAREERERIDAVTATIARIMTALDAAGVTFVLIKAFQHDPDMGTDIDVLVDDTGPAADRAIADALGARPRRSTPASAFAGRRMYDLPDTPAPVEIHHARLGLVGEQRALARGIVARRARATVEGLAVPIPGAEDQLLLQVIERVYVKRALRASDVLAIVRLSEGPLDRAALRDRARKAGIAGALDDLVRVATGLASRAAGGPDHLPAARPAGYPLGTTRVAAAYASTMSSALRTGDLERALRIVALPALALAAASRRVGRAVAGVGRRSAPQ